LSEVEMTNYCMTMISVPFVTPPKKYALETIIMLLL